MTARDRGAGLLGVQSRLTDRDLTLLGWLSDHGVLTTDQIAAALFPSLDFAQRRLLKLLHAGLVARFRPQRPDGGSYPYHYVLDDLGIQVVAAQRSDDGADPPRPDQARRRRWRLTNRTNLPHLLAVNQFFVDLAAHARTHPGTALERWWPSARCRRQGAFSHLDPGTSTTFFFLTLAPDGHGVWTTPDGRGGQRRTAFFVEVDLGTEDIPRLADKIPAYQSWTHTTGRCWPVLFWLTSTTRETNLHRRLSERPADITIATAVRHPDLPDAGPAGPVWWPCPHPARPAHPDRPAGRVHLADLHATYPPPPA